MPHSSKPTAIPDPYVVDRELRRVRPIIARIARRFPEWVHDDLVAVGMVRAWEMLRDGAPFDDECFGLVVTSVRWAMRDYLRSIRPGKRRNPVSVLSLDTLAEAAEHRPIPQLAHGGPLPLECLEAKEAHAGLHALIASLPRRYATVIRGTLEGRLQADMATELGVSSARVSQIRKAAMRKLAEKVRDS